MNPLILMPEEELREGEEFVGIKTIGIGEKNGNTLTGYVGIAKNTNKASDWRMITLKAERYKSMSDTVI